MSMEMTRPERRGPEWGGVMAAMALVDQTEPGPGWGWGTATEECAGLLCILTQVAGVRAQKPIFN